MPFWRSGKFSEGCPQGNAALPAKVTKGEAFLLARQGRPNIRCHSEERSDEESREQNSQRNHTGSFAGAQDDSMFWDPSLTPCRDCRFRACFATAQVGCGRKRQGCIDRRLVKAFGTAFGPLPLRFAQPLPLRGRHTDSFHPTQDIFSHEIPVFRPLFL